MFGKVYQPRRNISNTFGLQVFNVLRFVVFLIIAIVFTKIGLTKEEIGLFEISVFIANVATFFWTTGLIQAFLPLYKNNKTFGVNQNNLQTRSPEIFNTYVILVVFSLIIFFIGKAIQNNFSVFGYSGKVPLLNVTLWIMLLSSPANLVEYIYMIRNQSGNTLSYAYITYTFLLVAVLLPVILGYNVIWALRGLVAVAVVRNIWLFTLILNYAQFKISKSFIKEHLALAVPIIFSTLISGSAQYIDGLVVSTRYSAEGFAIFRYGAKELPFVVMLATGLSHSMLTEFDTKEKVLQTLGTLKKKSLRIMHMMYPLSTLMLLFAKPIYKNIFTEEFTRSADVFVIYLLAITSRLLFPHTILIGLKKTRTLFYISIVEFVLNVGLSLWLVNPYGVVGVALATVGTYFISKSFLVYYNYKRFKILPQEYIPMKWYIFYNAIFIIIFVILDHGFVEIG